MINSKELLGHGKFLPWIDHEFAMSKSAAANFMRVADTFDDKSTIIAHLNPTALYELAAPSTPETIIDEVKALSIDRVSITVADIKEMKAAALNDAENPMQKAYPSPSLIGPYRPLTHPWQCCGAAVEGDIRCGSNIKVPTKSQFANKAPLRCDSPQRLLSANAPPAIRWVGPFRSPATSRRLGSAQP